MDQVEVVLIQDLLMMVHLEEVVIHLQFLLLKEILVVTDLDQVVVEQAVEVVELLQLELIVVRNVV